ncbi:MAG: 2-hydroxyacid dehydrogenase [Gammaproteobacteria bacterium]|nr:2-hydroxyacid dehydrogenase [Gammaproteobacteria bacterium]
MRGVFLDSDTISVDDDIDLSPMHELPDIEWAWHGATRPGETADRIEGCGIVVTNKVVLDADSLARVADTLKLIVIAATGTNNVDLDAAARHGITVCNVRGYGTPSVVQHVYALILALTTQLPRYVSAVANGRWQRHPQFCILDFPIRELNGLKLGIVGFGTLGRGVADVAPAFGMDVLVAQRPGGGERKGRIPLDELLPRVDILSLHCPLTDDTRDLIGRRELQVMKNDALLINTARGGIVNENDLVDALCGGEIGGAAFDVLTTEPPEGGNVLLDADLPNLIVTPHIAWASRESRQRVVDIVAGNIDAWASGNPVNVV